MGVLIDEGQVTSVLAAHPLFRCEDDVQATSTKVGAVFRPHRMGVVGPRQRLSAEMNHTRVGSLSISRLGYRADVTIESDPMGSFLLLMIPLTGTADIRGGGASILSTPSLASVVGATSGLSMRWAASCNQLIFKIDRDALETTCAAQLGHVLPGPIEFELGMDLTRPSTLGLQRVVSLLASTDQFTNCAEQFPLMAVHAERLFLASLLSLQPHNFSAELQQPGQVPAPRYVKRAEDFIAEHAARAITIEDVARAVGVSVRSLQTGFKKYRQTSPMALLRDVRLQRVREDLIRAKLENRSTSVTATAMTWGFGHLGHFTRAYVEKFKELPSQTLRR